MNLSRAVAIGTALGLVFAAGCSGGQTGTAPFLPTTDSPIQSQTTQPSPAAYTPSAISTSSQVKESGKVTAVNSASIVMLTSTHGHVKVTFTKSTAIGGSLRVGYYVNVTGTGTMSGPIAATHIATGSTMSAATAQVSQSGKITSVGTGKINILTSSHGYVPVTYSSGTSISGSLKVGYYANVTGSGSVSGPISATAISTSSGSTVTESGKITSVGSGSLNMLTSAHGYVPVTYTSGTAVSVTLAVGAYINVTGTGALTGPISAISIAPTTSSPAGSTVESGQITSVGTGTFNMHTSAHGYVPVTFTSSTSFSGSLRVGYYANVSGTGSLSGPIAATSVTLTSSDPSGSTGGSTPPPSSGVLMHLSTGDYVGISTSMNVAYSRLAPYLTWAQTANRDADALHAAGIKTQHYVDPNRESTGDPLMPSTSSGYARTCGGTAITTTYHSLVRYVPNPGDSSFRSQWASYVNNDLGPTHYDALFDDDAEPPGTYGSYSPSLSCGYSDSSWISQEIGMLSYSKVPVIVNDLNALDGQNVSLTMQIVKSSAAWGGSYEECYNASNSAEEGGWAWQAMENSELQVNAAGKVFLCMGRYAGTASYNTAARIYMLASFLLTYDPNKDIYWEQFETPSHFHVEPESQLVPMNPVRSTPSSIMSLQTSSSGLYGAYGREYSHCYYAGVDKGACAVVVNPDSVSHPFPYSGYNHTLYLSGGGIIDGGTASVTGSAPSSSVGAKSAVIAFKN